MYSAANILYGRYEMRLWLKQLRKEQRKTQEDIARAMGVSKQYYSKLELGKTQQRMTIYTARMIAEAFGVSIMNVIIMETKSNIE